MATASAEIRRLKQQVRALQEQTKRLKKFAQKDRRWENVILKRRVNALIRTVRLGPPNVVPPPPPPR
jgi:hypothetical protein